MTQLGIDESLQSIGVASTKVRNNFLLSKILLSSTTRVWRDYNTYFKLEWLEYTKQEFIYVHVRFDTELHTRKHLESFHNVLL